ncbi:hypothetical protein A3F06_02555 [candidate division TM6 bacterium RIFCSPHIGHO2_12_FULL_36_22]|nr:MAG: hypothetical protein A3F06_02555 [candidate division TM6 bacterium RIFCSPHIGHO2_12_FULL_36_22]
MWANIICITFSAVLYAHALILWPLSWTVFIFLVPLFYVAQQHKLSFGYGFLWGFVFYVIHLLSICHWVAQTYAYGLVLGLSFAAYLALTPAVWFYISRLFAFSPYIWALSFFSYFIFHCKLQCLIFPSGYEYWLSLPMISFATTVWGKACLYWLGSYGSLVLIVVTNLLIYILITKQAWHQLVVLIAILVTLMFGVCLLKPNSIRPLWLDKIGYISPLCIHGESVYDKAFSLKQLLCIYAKSDVTTILMPESTLKTPLNRYPEICAWWHQACPQCLILGAHRQEKGLFNTLFIIKNGKILDYYDKCNPMPFIEFIPSRVVQSSLQKILFEAKKEFNFGNKEHTLTIVDQQFTTQICSDFYMTHNNSSLPIALFLNDYYIIPYSSLLFWYGALYRAITSQNGLLYVGHYNACWMTSGGLEQLA